MIRKPGADAATTFVPAAVEARQALRHDVVCRLLLEIFRGNLPAGTRLITHTLAKQLGVSATPLREALVELEAIGMVQISHNRGAVVAPFGPDELRGIYQVRRLLESEAARCACGRIDRDVLEDLREDLTAFLGHSSKSAAWLRTVMASDARFHSMIAVACGSPRLASEIGRYALLIQTISEAIGNRYHSKEDGIREHLEIIEALLAEDPERSARAMAKHVEATADRALGVIFSPSREGRSRTVVRGAVGPGGTGHTRGGLARGNGCRAAATPLDFPPGGYILCNLAAAVPRSQGAMRCTSRHGPVFDMRPLEPC